MGILIIISFNFNADIGIAVFFRNGQLPTSSWKYIRYFDVPTISVSSYTRCYGSIEYPTNAAKVYKIPPKPTRKGHYQAKVSVKMDDL